MTGNMEQRLYRLEAGLAALQQQMAAVLSQLATLAQQQYAGQGGYGGGGSGGPVYFGCTLGGALAHGSSVTGQTVWKLSGGSRSNVNTNATIYNDGPGASSDIASGKQVIVLSNDDGTFTASGVYC